MLPASVKKIDQGAFKANCFKEIAFCSESKLGAVEDYAFGSFGWSGCKSVSFPKSARVSTRVFDILPDDDF